MREHSKQRRRPQIARRPLSPTPKLTGPFHPQAWTLILCGLFLLSLLWRLAYVLRVSHSPLDDQLSADARIYWDWAHRIRHGDLVGTQPFFLGPLYPYVLAGVRTLVGDSLMGVRIVQSIWGALAVILLADAARRLTTTSVALVVGLLLCFYEMTVFFDGLLLMESLLLFLAALLLWLLYASDWPRAVGHVHLAIGLLVGMLAAGRATFALLVLPLMGLLVWQTPRRGLSPVVLTSLGAASILAPIAVRNAVVSGSFIPLTYNLGYNLYVGHNPEATGTTVPIAGANLGSLYAPAQDGGGEIDGRAFIRRREGLALTPTESSRYWAQKAGRYVRDHPAQALRLSLRKVGMMWNRREYAQIESVREYRSVAGPIGLLPVGSFAWLGTLALAGLWFAPAYGRRGWLLVGYAAIITCTAIPFFVTDRYRIHLVPPAALLAAITLQQLWTAARLRTATFRLRGIIPVILGVLVVQLPAPHFGPDASRWFQARDRGDRLLAEGRAEEAVRAFEEAIAWDRTRLDLGGPMTSSVLRARTLYRYHLALRSVGRVPDALPHLEDARRLTPDDPLITRALADGYHSTGLPARADSLYATLDSLQGGSGLAAASRGWQAAQRGALPEAELHFLRAVARAPRLYEAWGALVRVQAQVGKTGAARATLAQARDAGLPNSSFYAHLAFLAAVDGDFALARRSLSRVPVAALRADASLADIARLTRELMGNE